MINVTIESILKQTFTHTRIYSHQIVCVFIINVFLQNFPPHVSFFEFSIQHFKHPLPFENSAPLIPTRENVDDDDDDAMTSL